MRLTIGLICGVITGAVIVFDAGLKDTALAVGVVICGKKLYDSLSSERKDGK